MTGFASSPLFQAYSATVPAGAVTLALGHSGFYPALLMASMMGVAAILVFNFLVWQPTRRMSDAERETEV